MAAASGAGRGLVCGPVAPSAWLAAAQRGGAGGGGVAGARSASGLGRAQDPALPGGGWADAAGGLDRPCDPGPARPGEPADARGGRPSLRASGSEPPLADGLQGALCHEGSGLVPSADDDRRSLALCALPGGLRQRARPDGARPYRANLSVLRLAGCDLGRQWRALGRPDAGLDQARRVAAQARCRCPAQPALSSPDPGQERALPPDPQGRGAGDGDVPRPRRGAGRLRSLAPDLQSPAPAPGPRLRGPGQPLPPEPAIHAKQAARARVPGGRRAAHRRHDQGLYQLPRAAPARARRLPGRTRRRAPPRERWPLWGLLRGPPNRRLRSARPGARRPMRGPCPRATPRLAGLARRRDGFSRDEEIYPDGSERWAAAPREPAGPRRPPDHRRESPTGYSSAGCSPAEPASASPVPGMIARRHSFGGNIRGQYPAPSPMPFDEMTCHPCLRTGVTYVSGLNTRAWHPRVPTYRRSECARAKRIRCLWPTNSWMAGPSPGTTAERAVSSRRSRAQEAPGRTITVQPPWAVRQAMPLPVLEAVPRVSWRLNSRQLAPKPVVNSRPSLMAPLPTP